MGLDLNPLGKAKPGSETEFIDLFNMISSSSGIERDELLERWFSIQISPYETLHTPRIGIDQEATDWVIKKFREDGDQSESEDEHLKKHHGLYLPMLIKPCDGIPVYSNYSIGAAQVFSFRAQFIIDYCSDIVGAEIIDRLYTHVLPVDLKQLGEDLHKIAKKYAYDNKVDFVEEFRSSNFEDDSPELKAHILFAMEKWCGFWADQGHGAEANY